MVDEALYAIPEGKRGLEGGVREGPTVGITSGDGEDFEGVRVGWMGFDGGAGEDQALGCVFDLSPALP